METYVNSSISKYKIAEGHLVPSDMTRTKFESMLKRSNAKSVFEIGFNAGHSARLFLDIMKDDPYFRLHSIDIGEHDYVEPLMKELAEQDSRFTYQIIDSQELEMEDVDGYDMLFIDGSHDKDDFRNDLILGIVAQVPFILIDDYSKTGKFKRNVRLIADYVLADIGCKYNWVGKALHYESTGGSNMIRLAGSYKACNKLPGDLQQFLSKH